MHHYRALRKDFIISKYVDRKYVARRTTESPAARLKDLQDAVKDKDIFILLQAYAEKVDLNQALLEYRQVRLLLPQRADKHTYTLAEITPMLQEESSTHSPTRTGFIEPCKKVFAPRLYTKVIHKL